MTLGQLRRTSYVRPPVTEETKRKIGAASLGRRHSDATKQLLREQNLNRPPPSAETRAKLAISTTNLWRDQAWVRRSRRRCITSIEKIVYRWLNELGVRFHREVPIIGGVVDIYCPDFRMAVEVDGEYWHPEGNDADRLKDYERALGMIYTIRLREREIGSAVARNVLVAELRSRRKLLEELQTIYFEPDSEAMLTLVRRARLA